VSFINSVWFNSPPFVKSDLKSFIKINNSTTTIATTATVATKVIAILILI